MTNDVSENAANLIREAEGLMDEFIVKLDDDSLPAMERMAAATEVGGKLEELMGKVMAEGIGQDHPAVGKLMAKSAIIGQKLEALAKKGAAEVAEAMANPPPPSAEEELGRSAARLEGELVQAIVAALEDRPEEAAAVEKLRALRNEYVRRMHEIGVKREALDDKGKREYQGGWAKGTLDGKEARAAAKEAYGRIQKDYVTSAEMNRLFLELMGLNRFAEPERLRPADHELLEELGLK